MMTMEDSTLGMLRAGAFETMKQRIRECLKDLGIHRFAFHGWEGVGRSIFLRHAIDEFTLQAQHEYEEEGIRDNLYEIVWVTRPRSVSDLRAGMLKVVENEEYTGASYTYGFPFLNRKTMLILDEVQEPNIFDDVGNSVWEHVALPGSKIVITSPNKEIWRAMEIDVSINGNWEDLSEAAAWVLLWEEVKDVSNSLTTLNNIDTDSYNVMLCYCYSFLFPELFCNCALYWRSEGFIGAYENWKKMFSYYSPLLHMLHDRAMLHYSERGMVKFVKVHNSIKSKVVPVLERKGFLVRCNLKLEEISVVEEWEQENLKRISLAGTNVTTLTLPPKLPQLLTLILSENPLLHEIPDDFFQNMQGLRVLDMSRTAITSLPSSMSSLTNLRLLALQDCFGLNTLSLPLLHALQKLEVLLLEGSPLPGLKEFSLHMMESIYYIEIVDASNLTQLSVRGCCSLEYLNPPQNLEMLDLSSTKIRDFNDFSFSQLECLKHLDLLDTKHLKYVPWHDIHRLPQTLNWDRRSHQSPTKEQFDNHQGYCISVSDHKIFHLLSRDSELWEKYFKKFRFSVTSCDDHPRQRNQPEDTDNPFRRTHFIYSRIYTAKTTHFTEFIRSYDRCLEIGSTNDVPRGIHGVLYNTEFLSLCENNSITRLSHLGVENMDNLIECKIERCQNIQSLINIDRTTRTVVAFIRLENLLVFDLTNLKSLCRGTIGQGSFARLKHIYLEHCTRLFSLFSSSVHFENLEKLEIKFCDNLERLFEEDNVEGQDVFPQLKELYLLKLRKMKCICNGKLPALEKLKAHGCPLLQKLPLPLATGNKLNTVVIGGHQEWKRDLKWEEQLIKQHVKLNVPRAFKI